MNPVALRLAAWIATIFAWLDVLVAGHWESDAFCVSHALWCALIVPLSLAKVGLFGRPNGSTK